ncbi:MAG: aminoacetone oxidase family FAD-binding enzyme [Chthonomonas sp.]|nr:aminoacetone oxidase family FAD-binding enzyme [Chthonomonas sp.]
MREPTVAVVGAGAAGIIAAWRAASLGAKVVLLEKTPRIGTKIMISGGGKCNLTHDGSLEDILRAFRKNEAQFLRPSFYRFPPASFLKIVFSRGLEVYTRPDGRIFPVHQTAKDVVRILTDVIEEAGVEVRLDCRVMGLLIEAGRVIGVETEFGPLKADKVIVAAGGSSYPNSGTTGDAWAWLRTLGHKVTPLRAALAPIYLHDKAYSGLALRDVFLRGRSAGKEIARWRGDLLFTHQGISGPCALGVSREVAEAMEKGPVAFVVDGWPDETFESLREELIAEAKSSPHRLVRTHLEAKAPERYAERILDQAEIGTGTKLGTLGKKQRNQVVEFMKGLPLGEARAVPLEKGEVVAGGVELSEVDPKTMESRVVSSLFLCGEVLDIAGPVGGYNLQAAWSTGFVAGDTAATKSVK